MESNQNGAKTMNRFVWVGMIIYVLGFLFFTPWFIGMVGMGFDNNMNLLTKILLIGLANIMGMFWPLFILAII